jgi:catechol 2,3-dioxygenase-like lactoylglutathione lyase family enzyme
MSSLTATLIYVSTNGRDECMSTASLIMVNIDCANPPQQAAFYAAVLGWDVTHSQDEYAMISDGRTSIGFGKVDDYTPPAWPDSTDAKRFHLDLSVRDVATTETLCHELGARTPEFQPGGERWRVLLDPAGQPFCLCPNTDS